MPDSSIRCAKCHGLLSMPQNNMTNVDLCECPAGGDPRRGIISILKPYKIKATFIFLDGTQVHIVDTWQARSVHECYERVWQHRDETNIGALICAIHEETIETKFHQ